MFAFAVTLWLGVAPARAAETPPAPATAPAMTAADLERLVATLENDAERQKFVEQLRAVIAAERSVRPPAEAMPNRIATHFLETLSERIAGVGATALDTVAFVADAPNLYRWLVRQFEDDAPRRRLTEIASKLLLVLGGGWIAEWIAGFLLMRPTRRLEAQSVGDGWRRIPFVALHALLVLAPIVVFAAAAFGILALAAPSRTASLVALALINANLIARAIGLVAATIFAPRIPSLRLAPLADETAAYLFVWTRRLTNIVVYVYFAAGAGLLIGLPSIGYLFILKLLGAIVALLLVVLILQNRRDFAQTIAGPQRPGFRASEWRAWFARYWHLAAIGYVLVVFAIWVLRPQNGFEFVVRATGITVAILVAVRLATFLVRRLFAHIFAVSDEMRERFPAIEARTNRYLQILTVGAIAGIYILAALAVLHIWGLRSLDWLSTSTGRQVGASLLSIGITLAIALALWEAANAGFERYVSRAANDDLLGMRRAARARTLQPLLQRIMLIMLGMFVGLVLLSELGINITPLLAGAGAVGLAVGLGAQDMIKDLIRGVSILLEDSIAVGDVVQLGDKAGVVEWMSMRAIRLRGLDGAVHTVPFGEVTTISNLTKEFSFAVLEIGVSYNTDIDHAMKVMRETGADLRADPDIGPFILEDLDILGVDKFDDSAIIIKARFKTLPIRQWAVMRAYNRRIKIAFDRERIEIPFPQRTVHIVHQGGPPKPAGDAIKP
ncbi:MAG: mechanosensitive ion channel [Rhodospirillales bacterium]|nr:mechanosensitive ion channel [Rhodospirillales bacterium]